MTGSTRPRPGSLRNRVARFGLYAFLISSAAFFLLPLLLVIANSLKSMPELRAGNFLSLPIQPTTEAWAMAWSGACAGLDCDGIRAGLWNSVKITVPSVVISIFFGALNGYALAQWRSRHVGLVMLVVTIGLFIPYQAMIYPTVKMLSTLGLFRTYPGIVLIHVVYGLPYTTLLFRNFYVGVPDEISRAARMEGASFLRTFLSVMLPISVNIVVVVAILQFTGIWNDYLIGALFSTSANAPMTVELINIVNNTRGAASPNVNMAAALITAIPTLVVYFLSGRYFARGIAAGAVKG